MSHLPSVTRFLQHIPLPDLDYLEDGKSPSARVYRRLLINYYTNYIAAINSPSEITCSFRNDASRGICSENVHLK